MRALWALLALGCVGLRPGGDRADAASAADVVDAGDASRADAPVDAGCGAPGQACCAGAPACAAGACNPMTRRCP
ncbi:MAG: hypothetical protein U0324_21790 [Polyangiales bacterium]